MKSDLIQWGTGEGTWRKVGSGRTTLIAPIHRSSLYDCTCEYSPILLFLLLLLFVLPPQGLTFINLDCHYCISYASPSPTPQQ